MAPVVVGASRLVLPLAMEFHVSFGFLLKGLPVGREIMSSNLTAEPLKGVFVT